MILLTEMTRAERKLWYRQYRFFTNLAHSLGVLDPWEIDELAERYADASVRIFRNWMSPPAEDE